MDNPEPVGIQSLCPTDQLPMLCQIQGLYRKKTSSLFVGLILEFVELDTFGEWIVQVSKKLSLELNLLTPQIGSSGVIFFYMEAWNMAGKPEKGEAVQP